jgi:subtilisin family serine protease
LNSIPGKIYSGNTIENVIDIKTIECNGLVIHQGFDPRNITELPSIAMDVNMTEPTNTVSYSSVYSSVSTDFSTTTEQATSTTQTMAQRLVQSQAVWNLARISQRSVQIPAYFYSSRQGANIDVYVMDSGVDINHPEFENRASYGATFVPNEGPEDNFGHGTHVAGTISCLIIMQALLQLKLMALLNKQT